MKKVQFYIAIGLALLLLFPACSGKSKTDNTPDTFEAYVEEGWNKFADGYYASAIDNFLEAISMDATTAEAYTGLGWSYLRNNNLADGNQAFVDGEAATDPAAHLYAGWAFLLNALKAYSDSNEKATTALTMDADWEFDLGFPLDAADLYLLRADNFFLLGNFDESLQQVRLVNPAFDADVSTVEGQSELAAEIEILTGI